MTPVNFLDGPLIGHALLKRQRSVENFRRRFGTKESQQWRSHYRTSCGCAKKERDQDAQIQERGSTIRFLFHLVSFGDKNLVLHTGRRGRDILVVSDSLGPREPCRESLKPAGVGATSQLLILTGEQSGLRTRIATMGSVSFAGLFASPKKPCDTVISVLRQCGIYVV